MQGNYISYIIGETVVQAYLQHVYGTIDGYLTLITDNGKEFNNELSQKAAEEFGIKHYTQLHL